MYVFFFFFFFQAEDGIRDLTVTGVQTCALPISTLAAARQAFPRRRVVAVFQPHLFSRTALHGDALGRALAAADGGVVAPVYGAREQPPPGVGAGLVARGAVRAGATAGPLRQRATVT